MDRGEQQEEKKAASQRERTIVPILNYAYKIYFGFILVVLKFMRITNIFDTSKSVWAAKNLAFLCA